MGLSAADALVVVDVQRDFCPGGALAVTDGDAIVPVLNDWIAAARAGGAVVVASRDWHPADHCSFQTRGEDGSIRGGPWPPHCVASSPGAEFHPALRLPPEVLIVSKGTHATREAYSAFDGTDLAAQLKARGITRVYVGGLALDYCVKATALDALCGGFETHVILAATRAVDLTPGDGASAIAELRAAGVKLDP